MIKVGITGSLGSGKTTVSDFFKNKGHLVISADRINADLLEEKPIINYINQLLFKEKNDLLDKKRVAKLIYSNSEKKRALEAFLHPLIFKKMDFLAKSSKEKIVFLEIPLLFETNFTALVDYVIVVYLEEEIQINRVMKRDNINKDETVKRIKGQMPITEKLLKADYVIDNSGSFKNTEKQLNNWYINFMRRI